MKTNVRYIYSVMLLSVGSWAIKQGYFYIRNRTEMEFKYSDYAIIGSLSGLVLSNLIFKQGFIQTIYFTIGGAVYALFYSFCVKYFLNIREIKAKKLGIVL
jgi:hypothetical protein